jgi:hypothetical protein
VGSSVSGTVYVDDASAVGGADFYLAGAAPNASEVAAFSYAYTVGGAK